MRSLGIDIGRYSIKVVEVLANNKRYEIINAKEYKVLNFESSDHEIEILQVLNSISKEYDTETARVTCSIRQQYVSSRKLFFPFRERVKIQKSLAFELEDDIPLSVDKALYDSKVIRFHDKSAEVIAMACVTEELEKTLDMFSRGHIDPDIVTPEFSALANLYENFTLPAEEVSENDDRQYPADRMVVHIGHSKTVVAVVSRGHVVWGRSIMWGVENVTAAISKSFQVPLPASQDMMPDKAFILLNSENANGDQMKMSDTVIKAVEPLVQSLRLTLMLANTEYGAQVQKIEVIGGPSHIKNLPAFLTQELEVPTNQVNPIDNVSRFGVLNASQLKEVFAMPLGLALEGLKRPNNPPVNFRQAMFAKKNQSFEKFWDKWSYTAKIIAVAYVAYFIYGVAMDSISYQLEEASRDVLTDQASKIAGLKGRSASQSKIRSYIKQNNKKAKLVEVYGQLGDINTPMKFINEVSQILPPNKKDQSYDVRRFFVKDTEVDIQGVAKDDKIVASLEKALKNVAAGGKVSPTPATIKSEPGKKTFAFKFSVKRKN